MLLQAKTWTHLEEYTLLGHNNANQKSNKQRTKTTQDACTEQASPSPLPVDPKQHKCSMSNRNNTMPMTLVHDTNPYSNQKNA
jgi:hypothetical protein